jgi:hypothetical protein
MLLEDALKSVCLLLPKSKASKARADITARLQGIELGSEAADPFSDLAGRSCTSGAGASAAANSDDDEPVAAHAAQAAAAVSEARVHEGRRERRQALKQVRLLTGWCGCVGLCFASRQAKESHSPPRQL